MINTVLVIGEVNSGKSTLINMLLNRDVCKVSGLRLTNSFDTHEETEKNFMMVDSPGCIQATEFLTRFNNECVHRINTCLVSLSSKNAFGHEIWRVISQMKKEYKANIKVVLTHCDQVSDEELKLISEHIMKTARDNNVNLSRLFYTSKNNKDSYNDLRESLSESIQEVVVKSDCEVGTSKNEMAIDHAVSEVNRDLDPHIIKRAAKRSEASFNHHIADRLAAIENSSFVIKNFTSVKNLNDWIDELFSIQRNEADNIVKEDIRNLLEEKEFEVNKLRKKLVKQGILTNKEWYNYISKYDKRIDDDIVDILETSCDNKELKNDIKKELSVFPRMIERSKRNRVYITLALASLFIILAKLIPAFIKSSSEDLNTVERILMSFESIREIFNFSLLSLGTTVITLIIVYELVGYVYKSHMKQKIEKSVTKKNSKLSNLNEIILSENRKSLIKRYNDAREHYVREYRALIESVIERQGDKLEE